MSKFCYPLTDIQPRHVVKGRVPTGQTLHPGAVIRVDTLDTTDTSATANIDVYTANTPSAVADTDIAIVINQGFFENTNGQRPSGNPNVGNFEFTAGQVVTAIRCARDYSFVIGEDAIDNTDTTALAIDVKLVLQATDYQLATAASAGSSGIVFNVERVDSRPVGGNFGLTFETAAQARIVTGR